MKRLTESQKHEIGYLYANDAFTVIQLASMYNVTTSTIYRALHACIEKTIVDDTTAFKIRDRAISSTLSYREKNKMPFSNKIILDYDVLFENRKNHKKREKKMENLTIGEKRFIGYHYGRNLMSRKELAEELDVSTSCISRALKSCIVDDIVDDDIAFKIRDTALTSNQRRMKKGLPYCEEMEEKYIELFRLRNEEKSKKQKELAMRQISFFD